MRNYWTFLLAILFLGLSCAQQKEELKNGPPSSIDFEESWAEIESLEKKGMHRSAIQEVNRIITSASEEGEYPTLFKALAYRSRYVQHVEEQSTNPIIQSFHERIELANSPGKQLLQSALAELYHQYLASNLWNLAERTKRQNEESTDIEMMAEEELELRIIDLYLQSLEKEEDLLKSSLHDWESILNSNSTIDDLSKEFSLFDFLAKRAIDYFESEALYSKSYETLAEDEILFCKTAEFIKTDWKEKTKDPLVASWLFSLSKAIEYSNKQSKMTSHHLFNLRRFKSVAEYSTLHSKDELYEAALTNELNSAEQASWRDKLRYELALHKRRDGKLVKAVNDCRQCEDSLSLGAKRCQDLIAEIQASDHRLTAELIYPVGRSILFHYEYRNLDSVHFRIIELKEEDAWGKILDKNSLQEILKRSANRSWSKGLRLWNDYQSHSTELMAEGLDCGDYLLLASTRKDFHLDSSKFSLLHFKSSDIAFLERRLKNGDIEYQLKDRLSGKALNNAQLEIYLPSYDQKCNELICWKLQETLMADENGKVLLSAQSNLGSMALKIKQQEQYLIPNNRIYLYTNQREEQWREYADIFTDRSIYRAGQTVHFKAVLYRSKGEVEELLRDHSATIRLYDARGKEIDQMELVSNQMGSVAGSFDLPSDVLNGNFRLSAILSSTHFRVEAYKRPQLLVEFDSVKKALILGDTICVSGSILSANRLPIRAAKISYTVKRSDLYFPWHYIDRSYYPSRGNRIVESGTLDLEDEQFQICFETYKEEGKSSSAIYTIELNVNNSLGENIQEEKTFYLGQKPYSLLINAPENMEVEDLNLLTVQAEEVYGQKTSVSGMIELWSLKSPSKVYIEKEWGKVDHHLILEKEYNKAFPLYSYEESSVLSEIEEEKMLSSFSFKTNEALNSFGDLQEGPYLIKAYSISESGDTVQVEKRFRLYRKESKKPPFPTLFWHAVEKEKLLQGENISLQLNSSMKGVELLIELEYQNKIIESNRVLLDEEKKWLSFNTTKIEGDAYLHISGVIGGRPIAEITEITVEPKEKPFRIFLKTKRNVSSPGAKEKWSIGIENLKKNQEVEVLVSMYDASLDQLEKQEWRSHWKWRRGSSLEWTGRNSFQAQYARNFYFAYRNARAIYPSQIPSLNWFNFYLGYESDRYMVMADYADVAPVALNTVQEIEMEEEGTALTRKMPTAEKPQIQINEESIRDDFRETVFFYPQLFNKKMNEIPFSFLLPDALTRWKFRAIAHNADLEFSQVEHELISKKELMIQSYFPRFFRANDQSTLFLEVKNTSDLFQTGKMGMRFSNATNGKQLDLLDGPSEQNFQLAPNESFKMSLQFNCPDKAMKIKYQLYAIGEKHQDVEEGYLSILPASTLISESFPFELNAGESRTLQFNSFLEKLDQVEENRYYKVEYSADPRWLAVMALPSMIHEEDNNSEMLFSSLFAQSLAYHSLQQLKEPGIVKDYINQYEAQSKLENNQNVQYEDYDKGPWLSNAEEEKKQREKLKALYDPNQQAYAMKQNIEKLKELQLADGSWPWFKGMRSNLYLTQYINAGLGKLYALGVLNEKDISRSTKELLANSYEYMDVSIIKKLKKLKEDGIDEERDYLGPMDIQYLYARSFDPEWKPNGAATFYIKESEEHWHNKTPLLKAQIALAHFQMNKNSLLPQQLIASLKDNAIRDSLGVHWKINSAGPYWYQSPIETQAYLIELFSQANSMDPDLEGMRKWLLHQKNQQDWGGTVASAQACYNLLNDQIPLAKGMEDSYVAVGENSLSSSTSYLPAYASQLWEEDEIDRSLAEINVQQNEHTFGWGAAYWQYYESFDKINNKGKEGLQIHTKYYAYQISEEGTEELVPLENSSLEVGDLIVQRTEIMVDYDLEFVYISDEAPACLDRTEDRSGIQFKDGLMMYVNIKDEKRELYLDRLPKGRYVFETDYRISHSGTFSGGVSKLQSFYAPEFVTHSSAGGLKIK